MRDASTWRTAPKDAHLLSALHEASALHDARPHPPAVSNCVETQPVLARSCYEFDSSIIIIAITIWRSRSSVLFEFAPGEVLLRSPVVTCESSPLRVSWTTPMTVAFYHPDVFRYPVSFCCSMVARLLSSTGRCSTGYQGGRRMAAYARYPHGDYASQEADSSNRNDSLVL